MEDLGQFKTYFFSDGSKPPQLPLYATVSFDDYIGFPWHIRYPNIVPITPVYRGNRKQIPLHMAWTLTIHKPQGLNLQREIIDISNAERQGLNFTIISRVKSIDGLQISPPFIFEMYAKMSKSAYATIRKNEEQISLSIST